MRYANNRYQRHTHEKNPALDWRVWVGAVAMCIGFYAMIWGVAIACVLAGHGAEVCGL